MFKKIRKYFNLVKLFYTKAKNKIRNLYRKIDTKHLKFEVAELFFQHNGENDFLRYDMIVRLLAVENYFGINDFGFDLYRRMQGARVKPDYKDESVKRFKNLIASYDQKGYDNSSEIELDNQLHLIDGSHRMALAMYYDIKTISAQVRSYQLDVFYSIAWFKINGFTDVECEMLRKRYLQLKQRYQQPFVCTLWNPVANFYDNIIDNLSLFGKVVEVKYCDLNEWDYKFFTRGIYAVDDIEKWKIEKKLSYMIDNPSNLFHICMVTLLLEQPDFRLKDTTQKTLSKKCEIIKSVIRNAYKNKINNYYHDIILHIGDNFYQNQHIYRLFTMPKINVGAVFDSIQDCKYVLTKMNVDYMPSDFPKKYPLGKDLDIVCADKTEYQIVLGIIKDKVSVYNEKYTIRILPKIDSSGEELRTLIRLEQKSYLILQFDIGFRTGSINSDVFEREMIKNRVKISNYYIPNSQFEFVIRIDELHSYPHKLQHKKYLQEHINEIDETLCGKYLKYNWKKIISSLNATTKNNS